MTTRLISLIAHAAQGPGSRPVRFSLGAVMLAQGLTLGALIISTSLRTGSPFDEIDVLAAAVLNVLIAVLLVVAPWSAVSERVAAAVVSASLTLGTSSAVLATRGSAGLLNLAIPLAAFLAAVMFPWRYATAIVGTIVGSYLIGTLVHRVGGFRSWYELVEALLITLVVLVGTISMKQFLTRNARVLNEQNDALDARVRELTAVSHLARTVGVTTDKDLVWLQGLKMALKATACDAGIMLLRGEHGELRANHWLGLSDAAVTAVCRGRCLRECFGDAGWQLVAGARVIVVPDVRQRLSANDLAEPIEIPADVCGSLTAVPLALEGREFGTLAVIDSRGLLPAERGISVLETVATELALAIDRQDRVAEVERQTRQLEILHGIAQRVTASLEVHEVLQFAARETAAVADTDAAYIATLTGINGRLRIVAQDGIMTDGLLGLEIEEGRGIGGRVIEQRAIQQTEDYCLDPTLENGYRDIIGAEGLRTLIGLPLINRNRAIGVLYAARRRRQPFRAPEIKMLEMLSNQIAVALENARLFENVRSMSVHDPLTGVFNRRLFEQRLREEKRRVARHGHPLSLLMIDVDDFKRYNDTHGHQAGDELLKMLVAAMTQAIRSTDVLARYGGEEFVVLLPETDLAEATRAGERLCRGVRERFAREDGRARGVTVSVGVAAHNDRETVKPNLVERADAAMYRAKQLGKDRVVVDGVVSAARAAVVAPAG